MPLRVDISQIIRAEVIPWEAAEDGGEDLYGVAYTITEGREDSEPVGTRAEAEAVVQEIADQKVVAFDAQKRAGG